MDLERAYSLCVDLAMKHYENFPVARMVRKDLRKYVSAVYAFARTSDDIADEGHETLSGEDEARLEGLRQFGVELDKCIEGNLSELESKWDWIFVALADTIKRFEIPRELFKDLLSAFSQDVVKKRYKDFEELKDYCRRSANPVGRLVLILHGYRDEKMFKESDAICTGLQLANFWQDMSIDKLKNRIYIPMSDWGSLREEEIFSGEANKELRECLKFQVDRTECLFREGEGLCRKLKFPLSLEIAVTICGGRAILGKIEIQGYDTLSRRPSLNKVDKVKLFLKALIFGK